MKNLFILMAVATLSVVMTACSNDDDPKDELSVMNLSLNSIDSTAYEGKLEVISNCDWVATANNENVKVVPAEGTKGRTAVSVFIPDNQTAKVIIHTITFTSKKGSASANVSFEQAAPR